MKTVGITGATGFIGKILLQRLVKSNLPLRIKCLARSEPSIKVISGIVGNSSCLSWVRGDLLNELSLKKLVEGCDVVVNLAGITKGLVLEDFCSINVEGCQNLLEACISHGVGKFVHMSTLAAKRPEASYYAFSKYKSELVVQNSCSEVPSLILRPTAVYGPGDKELIPLLKLIRFGINFKIFPPSSQLSFLHVFDLCDAIINCVLQYLLKPEVCDLEKKISGPFELSDEVGSYSWDEVSRICRHSEELSKVKLPFLFNVPMSKEVLAVVAKLNEIFADLIGYSPMLTRDKLREATSGDWTCSPESFRTFCDQFSWKPKFTLQSGLKRI